MVQTFFKLEKTEDWTSLIFFHKSTIPQKHHQRFGKEDINLIKITDELCLQLVPLKQLDLMFNHSLTILAKRGTITKMFLFPLAENLVMSSPSPEVDIA
jgi:hypothetical protein